MDGTTARNPIIPAATERARAQASPGDTALEAPGRGSGPITTRSRRLSLRQALSVNRERLVWGRRTASWDTEGSQGLTSIVQAVLDRCHTPPGTLAVDLGCGSGQVTLPLAPRCARVLAVDVNGPAVTMLEGKAHKAGVANIQTMTESIQSLELERSSLDLVVTNYALHHLSNADKRAVLAEAHGWLRPGGQLVIGDMMLGRGATSGDGAIIAAKVRAMVVRGPAGWWRIAKNLWRFALRVKEKPLPVGAWERLVAAAGFESVQTTRIVQEGCVLSARKPAA
ncbi:MAG TPA: class I SAM-dependent methyltransferase [Solirubrobacteraceae bacterium]|jgi:2-polyprenyl-3-methyl-5-hydroxy-6-metoxy-1,4-benzoquinol methylase